MTSSAKNSKGPAAAPVRPTSGTLFGVALDKVTRLDPVSGLPVVIPKSIEYIRAEGLLELVVLMMVMMMIMMMMMMMMLM